MNGHFEINATYYPIGYLGDKDTGFKVTDMRSLQPLHSQTISLGQCKPICSTLNAVIRETPGVLSHESVSELVQAELSKL